MVDRLNLRSFASRHWWLGVVLVWLATRVSSTLLFLLVARTQVANYWTDGAPGYFEYLNIWDAEWFHRVFDHGYPVPLPIGSDGLVPQNEWAFMPGYPMVVRAFSTLTALDWAHASALVSLAASFGFALVAYRLIVLRFRPQVALWSLVLIGLSPASIVLQAGYAESLGLLLLAAGLLFWATNRLWLSAAAIVAMALTRPGAVAFSMAVFAVVLWRWWRGLDSGWPERFRLAVLGAITGAAGFAWLVIAWITTGRFDAYLVTELAWRRGYTDSAHLNLLEPWFASAEFWLGKGTGALVVLALFAVALWVMMTPAVRALPIELRAFSGAYLLYLALVFFPQSSTVRILFPAFGLLVALGARTVNLRPAAKYALIAGAVLLQLGWLLTCWRYSAPDFSPP